VAWLVATSVGMIDGDAIRLRWEADGSKRVDSVTQFLRWSQNDAYQNPVLCAPILVTWAMRPELMRRSGLLK
jgi:hypothetical protein